MKLIFATNNPHKVEEMQAAIGREFELVSLKEAGIDIDIPEPHDTLEANALEKSSTIFKSATLFLWLKTQFSSTSQIPGLPTFLLTVSKQQLKYSPTLVKAKP